MSANEPRQIQLHIVRQADAVEPTPQYSNFIQANYTPEDFTLHFGWYAIPPNVGTEPADKVVAPVTPVARITLPLNMLRNMIALLQYQLANYEENFGVIPDHPNKPPWLATQEQTDG